MAWLSQPVEALTALLDSSSASDAPVFDAIVIGSGYGGSVAALRLAEAGLKVCVLERGAEYGPGDFPGSLAELPMHVRIDSAGQQNPVGPDDALLDVRVGDETAVLIGNCLGGTSQINANVAIVPEPEIFLEGDGSKYAWPAGVQADARAMQAAPDDAAAGLSRWYTRARECLHAVTFPGVLKSGEYVTPLKSIEFDRAFETSRPADLTVRFEADGINPAGVQQAACRGCGNCFTGCNYGAKGATTTSYLPRARRAGAEIYTGAWVTGLEMEEKPLSPREPPLQLWTVSFLPTRDMARHRLWNHDHDAPHTPAHVKHRGRHAQMSPAEAAALPLGDPEPYAITAPIVVLAAGSIGSTEILLQAREQAKERARTGGAPFALSPQLGERFSGNGDQLCFGYWQDSKVNAVGWSTKQDTEGAIPVGPTITRIAPMPGATARERFLVEDGAVPGAITSVFQEIAALGGALTQLVGRSYKASSNGEARDPVGLGVEVTENTQVLLGIGHDQADGRIMLDAQTHRATVSWKALKPDPAKPDVTTPADDYLRRVDAAMSLVEDNGAVYLSNPAWQPLPPSAASMLSGPPLRNKLSIAHPMGGCVMADDAAMGVVNERGRVFSGSTGEHTYAGLYVLDGAMINGSLGANPFLTITALTERALDMERAHLTALAARARRASASAAHAEAALAVIARELPPQPPFPAKDADVFPEKRPSAIALYEVLRNPVQVAGGGTVDASLMVGFEAADMAAWLGNPAHLFTDVHAQLRVNLPANPAGRAVQPWVNYRSEGGTVSVLAPGDNGIFTRVGRWFAVVATWFITRGYQDVKGALKSAPVWKRQKPRSVFEKATNFLSKVWSLFKQAWHGTETRVMVYDLRLGIQDTDRKRALDAGYPEKLALKGGKYISYAADWSAIRSFISAFIHKHEYPRFLERPNVWDSMTALRMSVEDAGKPGVPWLSGVVKIDTADMSQHLTPQVTGGDTSPGLIRLLGYPMLFIRLLVKTRLWDFRLPDYGLPPQADGAQLHDTSPEVLRLVRPTHRLPAIDGRVPEFRSFTVQRSRDGSPFTLGLWRYRPASGKVPTGRVPGRGGLADSLQCRSVIIVHAFAQSALSFAETSIDGGMAKAFLDAGWDVWLLEHRISAALEGIDDKGKPDLKRESARRPSTMDDIGGADIPAAVDEVLTVLRGELRLPPTTQLRMYAFAQCVGAASLAMATLSGKLSYAAKPQDDGAERRMSKLAGVGLSQFVPFPVGDPDTQSRTQMPAMLRGIGGLTGINFSTLDSVRQATAEAAPADGSWPQDAYRAPWTMPETEEEAQQKPWIDPERMTGVDSVIDRVLASYPVTEADFRKDQGWGIPFDHAQATCRRIVGIEARLFAESNLGKETHLRMPILFGHANIELFNHARKCVEYERLVDNDGRNVYCTQDNFLRHMHMPVGLLHGIDNRLFNIESSERTAAVLGNIFGDTAGGTALIKIAGYGHLDSIIGEHADRDVYPHLMAYFDDAWQANAEGRPVSDAVSLPPGAAKAAVATGMPALKPRPAFRDSVWQNRADRDEPLAASPGAAPPSPDNVPAPAAPALTDAAPNAMRGFRLRLPVAGPLLGWCRAEESGAPALVARLYAQPDDSQTDDPLCLIVAYRARGAPAWTFHYLEPIATEAALAGVPTRLITFFADDISVPLTAFDDDGALDILALSVHLPAAEGQAPYARRTGGLRLQAPDYAQPGAPDLMRGPVAEPGASSVRANKPAASSEERGGEKPGSDAIGDLRRLLDAEPGLFDARIAALQAELGLARTQLYAPAPPTRSFQARQSRSMGEARARLQSRWRNDAAADGSANGSRNVQLFATTCRYPGFTVEQGRSETMSGRMQKLLDANAASADALLMLGDQIYADATGGLFDTTSPLEKYGGRYQALFASPRFRRLTGSVPVYMTPDDHEFNNNWAQEDMFQGKAGDAQYRTALGMLHACQLSHSPYGARAVAPPFDYFMRVRGIPVYMMDTITMRALPPGNVVDPKQLKSLADWLAKLDPEEPKIICTGAVSAPGFAAGLAPDNAVVPEQCADFTNWQAYPVQRKEFYDLLREKGGRNILLLSGDYHCAAQATLAYDGVPFAQAVVVPPLYAPMRYVNSVARELAEREVFGRYEITCPPPQRRDGSGYAGISLTRAAGSAQWTVAVNMMCEPFADA